MFLPLLLICLPLVLQLQLFNNMLRRSIALLSFIMALQQSASSQLLNKGQTLFIAGGGVVFVSGDVVHTSGTTLVNGKLIILGDVYNQDNGSQLFDKKSTGTISLSGAEQRIAGLNSISFPVLTLSGSGKKILELPASVRYTLHLNDRELITNEHSITIDNPDVTAVQRTSGYVNTDAGGKLVRATNSTNSYLFPLGSSEANNYRPVSIEPQNSSSAVYAATLLNHDPSANGYSIGSKRLDVTDIFNNYFFLLDQVSGSQNSNVKFYLNSSADGDYKQLVNWSKFLLWEKAAPSVAEDRDFNEGLSRSLLFSSTQRIQNMPFTFARSVEDNDPLTFFNAFSPDGDGRNDRWEIKNIDLFPDNELTIMNRWGDEVYRTKTYNSVKAWDGANVNAGTYYYVMKVNVNGLFKTYKGFITMIKKD